MKRSESRGRRASSPWRAEGSEREKKEKDKKNRSGRSRALRIVGVLGWGCGMWAVKLSACAPPALNSVLRHWNTPQAHAYCPLKRSASS